MKILKLTLCCLLLAACTTLPRGAAVQKEILQPKDKTAPAFAVYSVTKDFLPTVKNWPRTGTHKTFGWPKHRNTSSGPIAAPNDRINLVIWDSEDNSLLTSPGQKSVSMPNLLISQSGNIFIPYLGQVHVSGDSESAIRSKIQRMLEATIPSAQVQLQLTPGNRNMVDLVGGTNKPGSYPITDAHFTVLNLISQGGGVNPGLRNPQVKLQRRGRTYAKSLQSLYDSPALDSVLQRGDKVILEPDNRYFLALGATGNENLIYFTKDTISALDAMSLVGGISDQRANPAGILILRQYPKKAVRADNRGPDNARTVFTLDLTTADGLFSAGQFRINPNDTVFVTESPLNNTRTVLSLIGSVFGLASAVSNLN